MLISICNTALDGELGVVLLQYVVVVVGWDVASFPFAVIASKIQNVSVYSADTLSASNGVVVNLLFTT